MLNREKQFELFSFFFLMILFVWIITGPLLGAFAWPYAVNHWLQFLGNPKRLLWWQGSLIGLIPGFGQLSIALAVFTYIAMLFLT
jgi:hypothetical protein